MWDRPILVELTLVSKHSAKAAGLSVGLNMGPSKFINFNLKYIITAPIKPNNPT